VAIAWLLLGASALAASKPQPTGPITVPVLKLDGGRKLLLEGSFSSQREVEGKRGFWKKVVDVVAGAPEFKSMVRPYSIVTDSHNRIIITDPGAGGIHVFDFERQKYKFLAHAEGKDVLKAPQCVALDSQDNIYVTDSDAGKIFVFDAAGKLRQVIGSLKGGEGFFKRPTGIAVDSEAKRIYVTDTLRDKIYLLDLQGNVLQTFGKSGSEPGQFNYPTELRLQGDELIVVDAMNFRIQGLSRSGEFRYSIGQIGDSRGEFFRPKGVAVDSEGHIYSADGLYSVVQVFNREGQLLYYFGQEGTGFGDLRLPAGIFIDRKDRVFVVDSYNRRVEVFQYVSLGKAAGEVKQ
jgi:DNA-binding beta-propeller fold protein YncE